MSESTTFIGKVTFAAGTTYWTLEKADAGIILSAASGENTAGADQRFNLYGDGILVIQASNGLYLAFDATLDRYAATAERTGAPATFTRSTQGGAVTLVETTGGTTHDVIAKDGALTRALASTPPPAAATFVQTLIAPGLAEIQSSKVAPDLDLTWVDFAGADLSQVNFTGSTLTHAGFVGATLNRTIFNGTFLDHAVFDGCVLTAVMLNNVSAEGISLVGATIARSTSLAEMKAPQGIFHDLRTEPGTVFNGFAAPGGQFEGATLAGVVMNDADLTGASMVGVNMGGAYLSGTDFSGAVMTLTNCVGVTLRDAHFKGAQLAKGDFTGALLTNADFTEANLTSAKLRDAGDLNQLIFSGSLLVGVDLHELDFVALRTTFSATTDFTRANLDNCNFENFILDGVNFLYASMRHAKLDGTSIAKASMVGTDLSYASVTRNVNMVGTNMSNSRLEGAILKGVQMGPLRHVADLPVAHAETLNAGVAPAHPSLTAKAHQVEIRAPGESWRILADDRVLLLRHDGDAISVHAVDGDTTGAILSNAFMPNADFSEANLFAVDLSGANWYGGAASARAANLEQANLTRANVATMDFTQAIMYGVNLSFANAVGANFTGVKLIPTAQLKPVSLSFASLESTIFTDAVLNAANMTNAAVCLPIDDSALTTRGTFAFNLDGSYAIDLDGCFVTERLAAAFAAHSVSVTQYSPLVILQLSNLWICRNNITTGSVNYLLLNNTTTGQIDVYAQGPSEATTIDLPRVVGVPLAEMPSTLVADLNTGTLTSAVKTAFSDIGYGLDNTAVMMVPQTDRFWAIRNIDNSQTTRQTGYGQFYLLESEGPAGVTLKLYGAVPLLVVRTGADNAIQRVYSMFGPTLFGKHSLTESTTTPSGLKYGLQGPGLSYEYLMTAGLPPKPPTCVPSPTTWCTP